MNPLDTPIQRVMQEAKRYLYGLIIVIVSLATRVLTEYTQSASRISELMNEVSGSSLTLAGLYKVRGGSSSDKVLEAIFGLARGAQRAARMKR